MNLKRLLLLHIDTHPHIIDNFKMSSKNNMRKSLEKKYSIQFLSFLFLILISLSLHGCRVLYIFHVASGQLKVIANSIPIEDALKRGGLDSSQKYKLLLVDDIKEFGEKRLGLKVTENYSTVYMESEREPIYIISACPPDSLTPKTWWFPIIGRVPYLGFFDLRKAIKEKDKLEQKGYDVFVGAGTAYSTLGWFKDPVTLNMLNDSIVDLVDTILHEMTHTTIYLKGKSRFNEGLALMVGRVGAFMFLNERYGPKHLLTLYAKELINDELLFSKLINDLIIKLEKCYDSSMEFKEKMEQKKNLLLRFKARFQRKSTKFKTDYFNDFAKHELNNAYISITAIYHRDFKLFYLLLKENGNSIQKTLNSIKEIISKNGAPMNYLLTKYGQKSGQ